MIYERTYDELEELLRSRLDSRSLAAVGRAYELAEAAHAGQKRDEGTPYILHPLRVALTLVEEVKVCAPHLIAAALLHDVIEDSPTTREEIEAEFGAEVARVVWLLTKFAETSLPDYLAAIEAAAETGAPLVKLCDRLDNLRFLAHSPRLDKKHRYVRTTEIFYLPMARRHNEYLHREIRHWLEVARRASAPSGHRC